MADKRPPVKILADVEHAHGAHAVDVIGGMGDHRYVVTIRPGRPSTCTCVANETFRHERCRHIAAAEAALYHVPELTADESGQVRFVLEDVVVPS